MLFYYSTKPTSKGRALSSPTAYPYTPAPPVTPPMTSWMFLP